MDEQRCGWQEVRSISKPYRSGGEQAEVPHHEATPHKSRWLLAIAGLVPYDIWNLR